MTEPIRWGILGTGDIAGQFAKSLATLPDAKLVAVGSRNEATAKAFGEKFDLPRCHDSYQSLAEDEKVDVVYVASLHPWHAENSIQCLEAGKAVLCEKPFTMNAIEAERTVAVAREQKRFLMEAMYTRHLPILKQVKTWVDEGEIGEVKMVQANRLADGEFDPKGRHMNLALGGGSLLDVGCYVLSFCSMFFKEAPVSVQGCPHFCETGADDFGSVVLEYEGGGLGALSYGLAFKGKDTALVCGTGGRIRIHAPFWGGSQATLSLPGKNDVTVKKPVRGNGFEYEATEVMECLREGRLESKVMPLDESIRIMKIMDDLRSQWGLVYPGE